MTTPLLSPSASPDVTNDGLGSDGWFVAGIILIAGFAVTMLSFAYFDTRGARNEEYYILLICATLVVPIFAVTQVGNVWLAVLLVGLASFDVPTRRVTLTDFVLPTGDVAQDFATAKAHGCEGFTLLVSRARAESRDSWIGAFQRDHQSLDVIGHLE